MFSKSKKKLGQVNRDIDKTGEVVKKHEEDQPCRARALGLLQVLQEGLHESGSRVVPFAKDCPRAGSRFQSHVPHKE